jgi:hypothetical protein
MWHCSHFQTRQVSREWAEDLIESTKKDKASTKWMGYITALVIVCHPPSHNAAATGALILLVYPHAQPRGRVCTDTSEEPVSFVFTAKKKACLNMKTAGSSKALVTIYQTTRRHISGDSNAHSHCCDLNCHTVIFHVYTSDSHYAQWPCSLKSLHVSKMCKMRKALN